MDFLQTKTIIKFPIYLFYSIKRTKKNLQSLDLGNYWLWVALRFILTVTPQTGYIHPDEYFQTVEVFAGDVFGTEVSLPWEFNKSFPIRSIPLAYMTIYIPFSALNKISVLVDFYLRFNFLSHYILLIIPRLSMCFVSLISDICLFKICYYFCQNYKERLIIYASSFVSLVYMSRTFTNTVEIACFNILLCLVASCMAESEKVIYQRDFLQNKYNEASTVSDQVRITKLIKLLPKHSLQKSIPISAVTVSGFFNRPTFVLFAITPLFYWFQRGLNRQSTFLKDFHIRIFIFLIYCVPLTFLFILFDSSYYGYITWGEVLNFKINTNNFVITPLNFIQYNMDSSNLSMHGLHPRFLHFLVNIPLLFNVLGISGLIVIAKLCYRGSLSNWALLPKSQSITSLMTLSFIVPVIGLSIFPHQEPRFITPILIPLVFLYSHVVGDFEEGCKSVVPFRKRHRKPKQMSGMFKYPMKCIDYFERATEKFDNRYNIRGRYLTNLLKQDLTEANSSTKPMSTATEHGEVDERVKSTKGDKVEKNTTKRKLNLMKFWYFFNGCCLLFFGFIHQGGIYGLSKNFHQKLLVKPKYTTYHLVTSHIYSLPLHLISTKRNFKYKNTNFLTYEMGSDNFENINLKLITILRLAESRKKAIRRNYRVFYALPSSLFNEFRHSQIYYAANFTYEVQDVFYPHFSTEALPYFKLNITDEGNFKFPESLAPFHVFDCWTLRYLIEFLRQFGLVLIEVTLPPLR